MQISNTPTYISFEFFPKHKAYRMLPCSRNMVYPYVCQHFLSLMRCTHFYTFATPSGFKAKTNI